MRELNKIWIYLYFIVKSILSAISFVRGKSNIWRVRAAEAAPNGFSGILFLLKHFFKSGGGFKCSAFSQEKEKKKQKKKTRRVVKKRIYFYGQD